MAETGRGNIAKSETEMGEEAPSNLELIAPYFDQEILYHVICWYETNRKHDLKQLSGLKDKVKSQLVAPEMAAAMLVECEAEEAKLSNYITALKLYSKRYSGRAVVGTDKLTIKQLEEWSHENGVEMGDAQISLNSFETLLELAHKFYRLGCYEKARGLLDVGAGPAFDFTVSGADHGKRIACYWGALACCLMHQLTHKPVEGSCEGEKNSTVAEEGEGSGFGSPDGPPALTFDGAVHLVVKISDSVDSSSTRLGKGAGLIVRAWLLHWALIIMFQHYLELIHLKGTPPKSNMWSALQDWFFNERNLTVVSLACPHLVTYYAVYAILNRTRKDHFETVLTLVKSVKHKYKNALTMLLEALFVRYHFDGAQHHLSAILCACDKDYFLCKLGPTIQESCRLLIFETFCRIHQSINLDMIAAKLHMTPALVERWIINLIRHAGLDAKIDGEKNRVEMATATVELHQELPEKLRTLLVRSTMVCQNINRPFGTRADDGGKRGRHSKSNRHDGRHDGRHEGRHENRHEGRHEGRHENRYSNDNRHENRFSNDKRHDNRFFGDNRNENRFSNDPLRNRR